MAEDKSINGWNEWAKRVLHDIERGEENISELYEKVNEIKVELAIIKTKVGLIGAGCGLLAALGIELITRLTKL